MRLSTLAALPVHVIATSALVIPPTDPLNNAVAGSIASTNVTEKTVQALSALDHEYQKLEVLKQQLFMLGHEIHRQEHEIFALINKDFEECQGVKCYFQTAIQKTPDLFKLFKTHFSYYPKNVTSSGWNCPWPNTPVGAQELPLTLDADIANATPIPTPQSPSPPPPLPPVPPSPPLPAAPAASPAPPESPTPPTTPTPPIPHDPFVPGGEPFADHPPPPPPPPPPPEDGPFDFGPPQDRPWHHGPPPDYPDFSPWKHNPNHPPPPHGHDHKHKGFHMPHPAPRHKHFKLIIATTASVLSVLIFAVLFKALHYYCSNPRVRADRAARREECRTRREYRRAACQHRFRQCLSRMRGRRRNSRTGDYEEKRAMLQRANSVDAADHIMGADINSLRRAHEIVGQLMLAEEGRMHARSSSLPRSTSAAESPEASSSSRRSVRSLHTTTTLPPYAPPPPRYSQELSRDMEVVDGFRYTPTQSEATPDSSVSSFIIDDGDLCTESSVVDCRSRLSMDTESLAPSRSDDPANGKDMKSLELAGDRYRGQFD